MNGFIQIRSHHRRAPGSRFLGAGGVIPVFLLAFLTLSRHQAWAYTNIGAFWQAPSQSWTAMTSTGAPSVRTNILGVWSGSKMIIWGGNGSADGALFDPVANSWSTITSTGAPAGRSANVAVWTGKKAIIWGGQTGGGTPLNSGALYDPAADSWSAMTTGGAPSARSGAAFAWTGSKLFVYGGQGANYNDGGLYDPSSDSWAITTTTGAPAANLADTVGHGAVWTGSKVLVWGGRDSNCGAYSWGGLYDPTADTWTVMTTTGAPGGRSDFGYAWSGSAYFVWGGYSSCAGSVYSDGAIYNPTTNAWTSVTTTGAPTGEKLPSAVWTGTHFIVWGGADIGGTYTASGGIYSASANSWQSTTLQNAPAVRGRHAAVWTDSRMLVWGGDDGGSYLNNGATLNPAISQIAPGAFTIASATAPDYRQALITWNASTRASSYTVKRATVSGGPYTTVATNAVSPYLDSGLSDTTTYSYQVYANNSAGSTAATAEASVTTLTPSAFVWTGAGADSNWNTAANWNGGAAPNSAQVAIFHPAFCSGTRCNVTVSADPNVKGVDIRKGYQGQLTQSTGVAMTIGTSGWTQAGGAFVGGNSNITLFSGSFALKGAASFLSTSGSLILNNNDAVTTSFSIASTATFSHGNGTVTTTGLGASAVYNYSWPSGTTFYNLGFRYSRGTGVNTHNLPSGKTTVVLHNFLLGNDGGNPYCPSLSGGTIEIRGDITLSEGACGGTTSILVNGTGAQTYTTTGTTGYLPSLTIDKASGTLTPAAGTTNFGAQSFTLSQGSFTAPSGTFLIYNPIDASTRPFTLASGTTFTHNSGTVKFSGNGTASTYSFSIPDGVTFYNLSAMYNRGTGVQTYSIPSGQVLTVLNDFKMGNEGSTGGCAALTGGQVDVQGNLIEIAGACGGTTVVRAMGTGAQTYAGVSGSYLPKLKIDKSSGTFTPAAGTTDFGMNSFDLSQGSFDTPSGTLLMYNNQADGTALTFTVASGTTFNATAGTVWFSGMSSAGSHTLNAPSGVTFYDLKFGYARGAGVTSYTITAGQTLNVSHNLTIAHDTGATNGIGVNGGTLSVAGDVTFGTGAGGGSTALTLAGSGAQSITQGASATPVGGLITISNTGGTVSLASNVSFNTAGQTLSQVNGSTLDMAAHNLTIKGTPTLNGGTITKNGGTLTVNGSVVSGTGTMYGGTVN